jgi:hypothetical protein
MKRLLAVVTVLTLVAAALATHINAAPAAAGSGLAVPVAGSAPSGTFNGTFRITRFVNSGGQIFAQGVLTGIGTRAADGVSESIVRTVSTPVTSIGGTPSTVAAGAISTQAVCDVLNLVLGPLHLDLLGLVVDLNQVVLDITAESGQGNLLGNLLCAITGLLDGGNTNAIATALNQVLGILSGTGV